MNFFFFNFKTHFTLKHSVLNAVVVKNLRISHHRWRWILVRQDYVWERWTKCRGLRSPAGGGLVTRRTSDIGPDGQIRQKTWLWSSPLPLAAPSQAPINHAVHCLAACSWDSCVCCRQHCSGSLTLSAIFPNLLLLLLRIFLFFFLFFMRNYSSGAYFCFIKSKLELCGWCRVHFFVVEVQIYISTSSSNLSETQVFCLFWVFIFTVSDLMNALCSLQSTAL